MSQLRAAIYTRKSTEDGLDQSFNSLDAQREACEAYILSQKSEGWTPVRARYDDGGWSGGNMDRPGLKQLLADIAAGKIDVVMVYKVDRLTRSLSDFARIVEQFDRQGVSFVSVTQAFNTTTSMGRLTLNVLLSFAQFEREVTGERIRDKIAASKAKGMWMGGLPPFGYDPKERSLAINEPEAHIVRTIFQRYLKLGSVNLLADELDANGVRSRVRTTRAGKQYGGVALGRGVLLNLLRNRIYIGEIVHGDAVYPGLHPPIIERELFEAVQARLAGNGRVRRARSVRRAALTGLIYDSDGHRMSPAQARGKSGRPYLYYVSAPLMTGGKPNPTRLQRVPAKALELAVLDRLRRWSGRPDGSWSQLLPFVRRLVIHRDAIVAEVKPPDAESWDLNVDLNENCQSVAGESLRITSPVNFSTRGGRTWIIEGHGAKIRVKMDRALTTGLRRAHQELLKRGIAVQDIRGAAHDARGIEDPYLRRLCNLAFLAPDIQRAILEGRQPAGLTLSTLMETRVPLDWNRQREMLGF